MWFYWRDIYRWKVSFVSCGNWCIAECWERLALVYWPIWDKALKEQITTNFSSASEKLYLSNEIRALQLMHMHEKYRQFCVFFVCVCVRAHLALVVCPTCSTCFALISFASIHHFLIYFLSFSVLHVFASCAVLC